MKSSCLGGRCEATDVILGWVRSPTPTGGVRFSAAVDASDLGLQNWPKILIVKGPGSGTRTMERGRPFLDRSGEDLAGYEYHWRFAPDLVTLTVIND